MTIWQFFGAFGAGYVVLLGRSAWRQGELRQFLVSLAVVAALIGIVVGIVLAYSRM